MSGKGGSDKAKDTPEQRELAAVAAEKWNFAQEHLAPLENEYMQSVEQMDSAQNVSYIRGRTMQGQTQAQSGAQAQLGQRMGQAGINPNSGRFQGGQHGLAMDMAQAGGENLGRAQFEQDNQKILGLQNITAIGQGQAGQAQAGLSRLAQESNRNAISGAQNAFNRRSANLQLLGTVAGAGTRYGMQNLSAPAPTTDYQMNTGFDTQPNQFGLNDASGGFYDPMRGF